MPEPTVGTLEPLWIGPYRVLEVLGEGGMGLVYLAEQREPVQRRVALKVIKLGMDTKAVLARFEAERQVLAMMEHSCIAHVFDAGVSKEGRPYFAMEYIKGIPITDYCDQNKLSLRERIELFDKVCAALQHAHQRGIIHRDIKPSNILVTLQDGRPEPRIIDFGLAKALNQRLVEATVFTEQGQIIGTPEYMSPEQAGLGGLSIDARTDVYSLGVLLYELLTGTLPFSRRELHDVAYEELQRIIRERQPEKPSTKITTMGDEAAGAAASRQLDTKSLQRLLSGSLDSIVLRALAKDRTRRYETPLELAADLGRYLRGLPSLAPPETRWSSLLRYPGQHPVVVAAALVAVLVAANGQRLWEVVVPSAKKYSVVISVNPAEASVYLDGDRIGQGNPRPTVFDFSELQRHYLQAAHPDYMPELEIVTEEKVVAMLAAGLTLRLTLRSR